MAHLKSPIYGTCITQIMCDQTCGITSPQAAPSRWEAAADPQQPPVPALLAVPGRVLPAQVRGLAVRACRGILRKNVHSGAIRPLLPQTGPIAPRGGPQHPRMYGAISGEIGTPPRGNRGCPKVLVFSGVHPGCLATRVKDIKIITGLYRQKKFECRVLAACLARPFCALCRPPKGYYLSALPMFRRNRPGLRRRKRQLTTDSTCLAHFWPHKKKAGWCDEPD